MKRKKVVFCKARNKVTQTLGEFRIDTLSVLSSLCSGINKVTFKVDVCLFRQIVSYLSSLSNSRQFKITFFACDRGEFPIGTRENKFQSSENLCKHGQNFIISIISPVLLSVSYEVQHTFSKFGVARNDFF